MKFLVCSKRLYLKSNQSPAVVLDVAHFLTYV
jgi:hypothetical protein